MQDEITFNRFLSGVPLGDYIYQNMKYTEQIKQAAEWLKEADYVLLGVGAGMSTAAGAIYGGSWFTQNFAEFQAKYGQGPYADYMQDMYSAGFYPYPDEEAYWGYWCKEALLGGIDLDVTPLHKVLLRMLQDKKLFVLSTNADHQFEKAGLPKEDTFCTQGDYFHIQCAKGCHAKIYEATDLFRKMDADRQDCRIPSELVPKCPVCGGRMNMNLRADAYFVEDAAWHAAEKRFGAFLTEALESGKKVALLELGVGFNTPMIIRYPYERLALGLPQVKLIRLNLNEAMIPRAINDKALGINRDMAASIQDLAEKMRKIG